MVRTQIRMISMAGLVALLAAVIPTRAAGAVMTTDPVAHYDLTIYADYSQFYLGDSAFVADTGSPEFWSPAALQRRLAIAPPSLIGVGTARYDDVPVEIDILDGPPSEDIDAWDQVVEASIQVPTGRLVIDGAIRWEPGTSFELDLAPGTYRARVYYGGLDTADQDHYRIAVWSAATYEDLLVLRPAPSRP